MKEYETQDLKIPALCQTWVLEAQCTDLPKDVHDEVVKIWQDNNYGNDVYFYKWDSHWIDAEEEARYPAITKYLAKHNVTECLIHYWW
jgi:hypothetical protein